jgi:hypothetical protein
LIPAVFTIPTSCGHQELWDAAHNHHVAKFLALHVNLRHRIEQLSISVAWALESRENNFNQGHCVKEA